MPVKNSWQNGEQFNASDANAVADAVNAAYVKPDGGVPKSDLASAVQVSLGKADTAVQAVSASSISDSTATGRSVLTAADAAAARTALGVASIGSGAGDACAADDPRLSDARTPTAAGQVADLSIVAFGSNTARAVGTGDFPFGIKLQRAVVFSSVTFRCATADLSGSMQVALRKNNVAVSGSAVTLSSGSQVSGGTASGSWSFAAGDVITVYVNSVGTTPGKGLIADIRGLTS